MRGDARSGDPAAVFVARWVLGQASPGEVQAWAWELQALGADGPALRTLAGYEWTTRGEVAPLVERALGEAALQRPESQMAALILARDAARRILDVSRDPHEAAWEHAGHPGQRRHHTRGRLRAAAARRPVAPRATARVSPPGPLDDVHLP